MISIRTSLTPVERSSKAVVAGLFTLMILASLTEGIGLLLLVPMLGVLGDHLSWGMTVLALFSGSLVFWLLPGQRRAALSIGQSLGQANKAMQGNVQESLAELKTILLDLLFLLDVDSLQ